MLNKVGLGELCVIPGNPTGKSHSNNILEMLEDNHFLEFTRIPCLGNIALKH